MFDTLDRIEKVTKQLDTLLCYIHRDGGQYLEEHGRDKAYEDAILIICEWRDSKDILEKEISTLQNLVPYLGDGSCDICSGIPSTSRNICPSCVDSMWNNIS